MIPPATAKVDAADSPTSRRQAEDKKLLGALRNWVKAYRRGKLKVGDDYRNIAGKSLGRKAGVITKAMFQRHNGVLGPGQFSHREEIAVLLAAAGKDGSAAAAAVLLEFSAIGLDQVTPYTPSMIPFYLRELAERHLDAATGASTAWLSEVATGTSRLAAAKGLQPALRAAAARALGRRGKSDHAVVFQRCLADADPVVRLAACQPLGASGNKDHLACLVTALAKETTGIVRQHLHLWIARLISSCGHKVDAAQASEAAELLAKDLGQPTSWHFQTTLVELVHVHGRPSYVPQLIDLLARCADQPKHLHGDQLSGVLRQTVHQQLTRLTDSYYAMDDIRNWQSYWSRVQRGFVIAADRSGNPAAARQSWLARERQRRAAAGIAEPTPDPKRQLPAGMPRSEFFGIPVRGSNIRIVLDVGYGMRQALPITKAANRRRWAKAITRLAATKLESVGALRGLGPDTVFNVITFSDRCQTAFKQPTVAGAKAIARARRFIERQSPAKNYDLGAALTLALAAGRLRHGAPKTSADEIFVVSNHMNQYGSIKSPDDLVSLVEHACRFAKTRIHTVYLGSINDEDDKAELGLRTMQKIASATGGSFIQP